MLAGGSGVTAMVPILRAMLRESGDTPKCSLVYSNLTDQDIIMKSELNSMATKNRKRFKLWYTVDKPTSSSWKYGNGQITDVTIADWMPKPEPGILGKTSKVISSNVSGWKTRNRFLSILFFAVVICGPRDMVESCKKFLQAAKYEPDMMYIFAAPWYVCFLEVSILLLLSYCFLSRALPVNKLTDKWIRNRCWADPYYIQPNLHGESAGHRQISSVPFPTNLRNNFSFCRVKNYIAPLQLPASKGDAIFYGSESAVRCL